MNYAYRIFGRPFYNAIILILLFLLSNGINAQDKIRFNIDGAEALRIDKNNFGTNRLYLPFNKGNTLLGNGAGSNLGDGASGFQGDHNTAVGVLALQKATIGESNTAFGSNAMREAITTRSSVAFGSSALSYSSGGERSVAVGSAAASLDTLSEHSVYIGYSAGYGGGLFHSKNKNVMVGYLSGFSARGNSNVFLGHQSGYFETGDHKLYIENTSADANNALIYGEFDNDLLRVNGTLHVNGTMNIDGAYDLTSTVGSSGQVLHSNGAGATYWGNDNSSPWGYDGDNIIYEDGYVGVLTDAPSDALHVVGSGADDLFRVQLGTSTKMRIYNNGSIALGTNNTGVSANDVYVANDLGIGVTTPDFPLHVKDLNSNNVIAKIENTSTNSFADGLLIKLGPVTNPTTNNDFVILQDGNGTVIGSIDGNGSGGVKYNTTSDRRLKMNIEDYTAGLDLINKIEPREYERKSLPGKKEIGFIAQELYEVYPQAVAGTPDSSIDEPMMVDYSTLTPVLVAALKEQQKQIDALQKELASKDASYEDLRAEVAAIRAMLSK